MGEWSQPRRVELGLTGDRRFTVELRRLGVYRARQWEFVITGNIDFTLSSLEESVELRTS
jgi:hypothetical protein